MRRILIIAYHFPPDAAVGALRPLKFAKYLPQFGWEPWVLTVRPEYYESLDRSRLDEVRYLSKVFPTRMLPHPNALYKSVKASCYTVTGRRQEFSRKLIEADVHPDSHGRLGKIRKFLGMLMWIPPDEVLGWLPIAALKGIRLVKAHRITHIYTTNPPHTTHLVGLAIRSFCDVRWVADFRDLWLFDKPFQTRTADRIERWMERKVVEKADAVTLTTDRMADKFRETYPTVDPKKFATIWNGYDGEDFQSIRPAGDREKFTLTYLGSFYDERTPEPLLVAVSELVTAGEIPHDALEIELIGHCRYVKGRATDEIAASLGLGSVVKVIDPVPYKCALEYAVNSHLLVLLAPDQPYEIPGKAYEYLASGVSILALTQDGATADLIRNTGGGSVVDPKDIGGIKRAVFDRYVTWAAHRSCYPRRPPAEARMYERRELTKRLVSILEPGT